MTARETESGGVREETRLDLDVFCVVSDLLLCYTHVELQHIHASKVFVPFGSP